MATRTKRTLAGLTAGLALGALGTICEAREVPGILRISDEAQPAVVDAEPAQSTPVAEAPAHAHHGGHAYGAPVEYGTPVYGGYGYGGGYNTVHRYPVVYTRWYPERWYGTPGPRPASPAPMVYMPTDTTQLGYYYQVVPRWQPRANPIPKPWFVREQEMSYGYHQGYRGHSYGAPVYGAPVEAAPEGESHPSDAPDTLTPGPAVPVPNGEVPDDLPPSEPAPEVPADSTAAPVAPAFPTPGASLPLPPIR